MKNVPIKYWNFQIDIINKHANYLNFRDSWQYLIYRKKAYFYDQLLCDNEADKEAIRVEMEGLGLWLRGEQSLYSAGRKHECRQDICNVNVFMV